MARRAGGAGILPPAMALGWGLVLGAAGLWEQVGQPRAAPGTGDGSRPAPASSAAQLTGHHILAWDVHPSWTQVEVGAAIADTSPAALQIREKVTAGFINVQCGSVSYFLKFLFKEEISLSYFPI